MTCVDVTDMLCMCAITGVVHVALVVVMTEDVVLVTWLQLAATCGDITGNVICCWGLMLLMGIEDGCGI